MQFYVPPPPPPPHPAKQCHNPKGDFIYIFSTVAITICLKATAKQPLPSKIVSYRQVALLLVPRTTITFTVNKLSWHLKPSPENREQPQVRQEDVQYLIQYRVLTTPPRGVGNEQLSVWNPLSFCLCFTLEPVFFSCIAGSSISALLLTPS